MKPDMMLFAKGIGSGFPIGGIACGDDLYSKMTPGMMVRRPVNTVPWFFDVSWLPLTSWTGARIPCEHGGGRIQDLCEGKSAAHS